MRPEGLSHWKIPVTPKGIELVTFRFVAQCLNQLQRKVTVFKVLCFLSDKAGSVILVWRNPVRFQEQIVCVISSTSITLTFFYTSKFANVQNYVSAQEFLLVRVRVASFHYTTKIIVFKVFIIWSSFVLLSAKPTSYLEKRSNCTVQGVAKICLTRCLQCQVTYTSFCIPDCSGMTTRAPSYVLSLTQENAVDLHSVGKVP
jgi:hypothetical protein